MQFDDLIIWKLTSQQCLLQGTLRYEKVCLKGSKLFFNLHHLSPLGDRAGLKINKKHNQLPPWGIEGAAKHFLHEYKQSI